MSAAVSIVVPSLADRELLRGCLTSLEAELERRTPADEVLVVDDTGTGELRGWLESEYPQVGVLVHERNLGFAAALLGGVRAARHEHVLGLNPDVRLRRGVLEPLLECLAQEGVRAVAPLVLDAQGELGEESLPRLVVERGLPRVECLSLEVRPGEPCAAHPRGIPVDFCLGGAFLFRREDFLARPFDPRFEPFYWEDVDWGREAQRAGQRLLVDPRAVVEHHSRGTISARVPEVLRRAAIEKNRLLFAWKHLEQPAERREHLRELGSRLVEHALCEEREALVWFLLAHEQVADSGP